MEIEVFRNAESFTAIFQYVRLMSDTVTLRFNNERMYLQTMDAAHVSIAELSIPPSWFDVYHISSRAPISVSINITIMSRVLNVREKDQRIRILYTPNADMLDIHIIGGAADKHFSIPTMSLIMDVVDITAMNYQAEITMQSSVLSNIIAQLRMFGDTVAITCCEERAQLASSNELGKMAVDVSIEDMTGYAIEEDAVVSATYSLNYMHAFLTYNKISKYIDVKISNNCPLQLIYWVGVDASLRFFLAPKIDDDN